MYSRIPYLINDWSSWAIHCFFLRHLLYYTAVWLGASPSVPLTCVMSSCALQIADLASSVADFILSVNLLTVSSPEGTWLGSKPIWGIRPVSSRNGGCCVIEWTWLLCWNSTMGRRSYQSSCCSLMNRQRNWSSFWLTHSVCLSIWGCQAACHDLAKWLSHYLISLFFSFLLVLNIVFLFLFFSFKLVITDAREQVDS